MSDIIRVKNNTVEVLKESVDHYEALQYIKDNYPKYLGDIQGITFDQVLPSDDSQEYIGIDEGSLIFVISNPSTYQTTQYLQLIYQDGHCEDLYDNGGNLIYGKLEDD